MKGLLTILTTIMMMNMCNGQTRKEPVVRPATQANRFYTGDAKELSEEVDSLLALHRGETEYRDVAALIGKVEVTVPLKDAEKPSFPYLVRITDTHLNYRKGPGKNYASRGYIKPGTYTIVDEQDGWGLLKAFSDARNGWVMLKYTTKK